ncbi:protein YIPF5/7 [Geosmithia morbida]|uniref:Protein YIP n=1 Tax=Geosmithia morbida TaxID=1094350 RepID=A0A9P5D006_9HYPO|nr:protein YIPF5/7 [Geosmithia morbida]KAF4122208.1 protein YIPF5/7 [Geosmithia morbida]
MSNYYAPQQPYAPAGGAQNLQFYPTTYDTSATSQPQQHASFGFGGSPNPAQAGFTNAGFGPAPGAGVSGRMGEQGGLRTGWLAAFSTEGYDGEPPLLEELGVNFAHIQAKTLAVLNPFRPIDRHIMDDSDMAGPCLFFLLFGFFLLFSGQVHFGYIYGLALLGSISLHTILSLMSPTEAEQQQQQQQAATSAYQSYPDATAAGAAVSGGHFSATLTFPRSASVLGYCLLPLVATSLVGVVVPMNTFFGHMLTLAAIIWCTYSASGMFCAVGRMSAMRALVAYPLGLFYVGFGLMSIFSSRGALAVVATSSSS